MEMPVTLPALYLLVAWTWAWLVSGGGRGVAAALFVPQEVGGATPPAPYRGGGPGRGRAAGGGGGGGRGDWAAPGMWCGRRGRAAGGGGRPVDVPARRDGQAPPPHRGGRPQPIGRGRAGRVAPACRAGGSVAVHRSCS